MTSPGASSRSQRRARRAWLGEGVAGRIVEGGGETVLWIHGYTLDSSSWREIWQRLPGWRHVGIDLPGHGGTPPLTPGETLPRLAHHLLAVAGRQEARHLVALSFGTLVALQMALEAPDRFASIALAAPTLGGGPQEEAVGERYGELVQHYRKRGAGHHLRDLWMTSPPDLFKGAADRPDLWRALRRVVGRHAWTELSDGWIARLGKEVQAESELRRISSSLLLLVGEREMPAFKRSAELIRRAVPRAQRQYLPRAGHLCLLEDPDRAQAALTAHFLANQAKDGDGAASPR